ncbi:MAG: hypothetical protein EOP56_15070 [Sphingobacteriales bacterium]|nr:MAG: hypothetical protein EOP56_15070 [Sphingobacteriales bacterium]
MEFTLVNGRFTAEEAQTLLANLVKVKTDFHLSKIDVVNQSEEDIKHSEKRIKDIERESGRLKDMIQAGAYKHVGMHAKLVLEFVPDYVNM